MKTKGRLAVTDIADRDIQPGPAATHKLNSVVKVSAATYKTAKNA